MKVRTTLTRVKKKSHAIFAIFGRERLFYAECTFGMVMEAACRYGTTALGPKGMKV